MDREVAEDGERFPTLSIGVYLKKNSAEKVLTFQPFTSLISSNRQRTSFCDSRARWVTEGVFMYLQATVLTLLAWFVGLFLDANLDWQPKGSLCFTTLFPLLTMGLCILKAIKENGGKRE